MCFAIFFAFKGLMWTSQAGWGTRDGLARYLLAWPGMDARPFFRGPSVVTRPTSREWTWGCAKILTGAALLWGGVRLVPAEHPLLAGWIGMIGLVLLLHFGVFELLALGWRAWGVNVEPIMNSPWRSTSLGEFWGRRWNRAFRDLSDRLILRPLLPRIGPTAAMGVVFLVSGLIHDVVISLPAGAGYGGPTFYFLGQAVVMAGQRSTVGRTWRLDRGVRGWLTTVIALIAPLGLLFHGPFVLRVFVPFLDAIGAR